MQGQALKEWREQRGWSQEQAARYLGASQVSVSRWETGTHVIPGTVERLVYLFQQERNIRAIDTFLFKTP